METEGVDFKGALELLADRFNVRARARGGGSAGRRAAQAPRAPARAARAHRDVLRAPAVGVARGRARARVPRRARPRGGRRCASFASATRRAPGTPCSTASRRAGFGNRELYDAGLAQSSEAERQDLRPLPLADHLPARRPARARARLRRAARSATSDDRRPEVRQQPRERALPQGPPALRRRPRARGRGEGRLRRRGRGLHRRHRDAPGRHAQLRRDHGHGAHRRPDRRARSASRPRCGSRSTPTARARRRCCAPRASRSGAIRRCACASSALPPGEDPADLVKRTGGDEIRERVEASVPFVRFRVLRALETGDLASAEGRDRVIDELSDVLLPMRPERRARGAAAHRRRPADMSPELLEQRLPRGSGRGRGGAARGTQGRARRRAAESSAPRAHRALVPGALHRAAGRSGRPALAELDLDADLTSAFTRRAARAPARAPRRPDRRASPTTIRCWRSCASSPSATRGRAARHAGGVRDRAPAPHARAPGPRDRRGARSQRAATSPSSRAAQGGRQAAAVDDAVDAGDVRRRPRGARA